MTRYVAFNPSSSETSDFVEGNSLRDILYQLGSRGYLSQESYEDARRSLRRVTRGYYQIEGIEVYELRFHPALREQVNQWRTVIA